tara:strand:- start:2969 stop:3145 length:177 start_codon:yes stop_codon:yes gene_type:complete
MLTNPVTKDILALAGLISTPCFLLITWMYNNGIKNLRKDIAKLFDRLEEHVKLYHIDK